MTHMDPARTAPFTGETDMIDFTPVPFTSKRHDGWTPDRQRKFIYHLSRIGVVSAAAKTVGMSRTSAYKLRERTGAESFAEAWDLALDLGHGNVDDLAITRAIDGYTVPYFYGGRQRGEIRRYDNRLLIASLAARRETLASPLIKNGSTESELYYLHLLSTFTTQEVT